MANAERCEFPGPMKNNAPTHRINDMMHITALDLDRESVTDYNDISYRFMWQDAACGE